ncbi:MAG: PHP domain-containing protein [Chloroflexota bacterium]
MASKVDLHIHSTASDGRYSPAEIVQKAAAAGLAVMALADHDTVAGIVPALEAVRAYPGLRLIPCVEINTDVASGEAHVLGYFIDYTCEELLTNLQRMRGSREERAKGMMAKLDKLGLPLAWERVRELASGGSIGRPHIAQAMLEKGYIHTIREAFDKYIGWGGPAYVERKKMTPVEAVKLVLAASGLPVLAHPFTFENPEAMITELKAAGLIGLEAYYGSYSASQVNRLVGLAQENHLLTTGGSDYHGLDESAEVPIGGVNVPLASAERLFTLAKQQNLKMARP